MSLDANDHRARLEEKALSRTWFYKYRLPSGRHTETYVDDDVLKIHDTRLEMMNNVLAKTFGSELSSKSAIDLSSHQGFFSFELAKQLDSVKGLERQEVHVNSARLMSEILGCQNVEFLQGNLFDDDLASRLGQSDAVVMFGLLYNLEDPIRGIRIAKSLAKTLLIIETQTIGIDLVGRVDSGHYRWQNEMKGVFGVFPGLPEALDGSETNMMLYPSPRALVWILEQLGFSSVRVVDVPKGGYEQLASGKRMMVAATL